MANGISFIHVIVTEDFKQQYNIALAKAGKSMKAHVVECMEQLILDTSGKKKPETKSDKLFDKIGKEKKQK